MTPRKTMKAAKRRKDYEKKRNIIRGNSKRVTRNPRTKLVKWAEPRVTLPPKKANKAPKKTV